MPRPVDALRTNRGMLAPSGCVLIAEELVADEFTVLAPELERPLRVKRVSFLRAAMGDPGTSATGIVLRPATLRSYARRGGFATVDILPLRSYK